MKDDETREAPKVAKESRYERGKPSASVPGTRAQHKTPPEKYCCKSYERTLNE